MNTRNDFANYAKLKPNETEYDLNKVSKIRGVLTHR